MKTKIIVIISIIALLSCKAYINIVKIKQIQSDNYSIIIRDTMNNKIVKIIYMLNFEMWKNDSKDIRISLPDYFYKNEKKWSADMILYSYFADTLLYINQPNNKDRFLGCEGKKYVIKIPYMVDTMQNIQSLFVPYLDKMKAEGKDTLHIESIPQLKQINPDLVNGFLQGDSIRFVFYYDNKYHRITLPVEAK